MNEELRKYYEARFNLFASQGWRDLIEDIDSRIDAISSIKAVKDIETLCRRQGEMETLEWLKSLPALSRDVYEELMEKNHVSNI